MRRFSTTSTVQEVVVRIVETGGSRSDRHHEKWKGQLLQTQCIGKDGGQVKFEFEA